MRVLVCGGRDYRNKAHLFRYLDAMDVTEVIHGGANGADSLAGTWALQRDIPSTVYPADWATYGRRAGVIRNYEMLKQSEPDVVVAFPGGKGTQHMIAIARKAGVRVLDVKGDDWLPPREMQIHMIEEEP